MPRIDVPADTDPLVFLWTERARPLTSTAGAFSDAVYRRSSLPLREFEAARTRIAQINDCTICKGWRTARDVPGWSDDPEAVPEEFYDHVGRDWDGFSERERLAAEFAERFALDHPAMDDDLWIRLHGAYADDELADLTMCCGMFLGLGRVLAVIGVRAPDERILV